MKSQGRMAVIVAPKAPFYAWPLLFLEKKPPDCNPEDFRTIFLLPERDDVDEALESVYPDIFVEMSQSWINATGLWLPLETLESFHKWFEVQLVKRVIEAAPGEVPRETL